VGELSGKQEEPAKINPSDIDKHHGNN